MTTNLGESPSEVLSSGMSVGMRYLDHQNTEQKPENDKMISDSSVKKPHSKAESAGRENLAQTPSKDPENIESPGIVPSANPSSEDSDSDDEFISSGEDDALDMSNGPDSHHHRLTIGSGIAEHTAFFEKSLSEALDSVCLDSPLVMQAQLSGQLNDKAKLLAEKNAEIVNRIHELRKLHKEYIGENKIGDLEKDIDHLASRIKALKHGKFSGSLFRKKSSLGVVDRFPIEYNQARDKVLERSPS